MLLKLTPSSRSRFDFSNSNYNYDNTNTNVSSHLCNICGINPATWQKITNLKGALVLDGEDDPIQSKGISLVNTPGTVDSDYRGLVNLIMINHGQEPFTIQRGDRIAQMVIKEVVRAEIEPARDLDNTVRSHGGFGHTGI